MDGEDVKGDMLVRDNINKGVTKWPSACSVMAVKRTTPLYQEADVLNLKKVIKSEKKVLLISSTPH